MGFQFGVEFETPASGNGAPRRGKEIYTSRQAGWQAVGPVVVEGPPEVALTGHRGWSGAGDADRPQEMERRPGSWVEDG